MLKVYLTQYHYEYVFKYDILFSGKNGRPNLTAANGKVSSTPDETVKPNGVKHITGPDGTKWVCLLLALNIAWIYHVHL